MIQEIFQDTLFTKTLNVYIIRAHYLWGGNGKLLTSAGFFNMTTWIISNDMHFFANVRNLRSK